MTSVVVIGIYVDDIDAAVEFYCTKLGFKEAQRYANGCIVRLENEGPTLILEQVDGKSPIREIGTPQIVVCVEAKDIVSTMKDLKTKGVDFIHAKPQEFVAGLFNVMRDPSGNLVELLQFNQE
ncbi:MAG: VOC family protein [Candidatus Thorarchaeota archaeon]